MDLLALFDFNSIQTFIEGGSYLVLFGLLFACGLGLPVPEDIPLLISGALIAAGKMHWVPAAITAWCGIIGGDCVLYHLGRRFGMEVTRLPFVGKHLTRSRIAQVEELFNKYGVGVVAIGRLFAGIRGAMVVAAGAIRFNFIKFLIADGIAALISGGFFMLAGHWLGKKLDAQTIRQFKHWFILGGIVLAILFVGWIIAQRRRKKQHDAELAAAEQIK